MLEKVYLTPHPSLFESMTSSPWGVNIGNLYGNNPLDNQMINFRNMIASHLREYLIENRGNRLDLLQIQNFLELYLRKIGLNISYFGLFLILEPTLLDFNMLLLLDEFNFSLHFVEPGQLFNIFPSFILENLGENYLTSLILNNKLDVSFFILSEILRQIDYNILETYLRIRELVNWPEKLDTVTRTIKKVGPFENILSLFDIARDRRLVRKQFRFKNSEGKRSGIYSFTLVYEPVIRYMNRFATWGNRDNTIYNGLLENLYRFFTLDPLGLNNHSMLNETDTDTLNRSFSELNITPLPENESDDSESGYESDETIRAIDNSRNTYNAENRSRGFQGETEGQGSSNNNQNSNNSEDNNFSDDQNDNSYTGKGKGKAI